MPHLHEATRTGADAGVACQAEGEAVVSGVIPFPSPEPDPVVSMIDDFMRAFVDMVPDITVGELLNEISDRPIRDVVQEFLP